MKLEDIEVGQRYVFNNAQLPDDEDNGIILTVQSAGLGFLGMLDCIDDTGHEGYALPEELSPLPKEN